MLNYLMYLFQNIILYILVRKEREGGEGDKEIYV